MSRLLRCFLTLNSASLTLGSIALVIILFVSENPLLELIELKTYDLRLRSRGIEQPRSNVVVTAIDEKSLDVEGPWPWPRSRIAKLVEILSRDGARVIGFDIGFLEPDRNVGLQLLNRLQQQLNAMPNENPGLADFIEVNREHEDNDKQLVKAIQDASAAIVLGYFFHMSQADLGHQLEPREIDKQLSRILASKYPFVMFRDLGMEAPPFLTAYAPESNISMLSEAADASGHFSLLSDLDGTIRWMPMMIQAGEHVYPPLAVMCVWHYLNKPQLVVHAARYGVVGVERGERFIPTDRRGRLLINYLGPRKTFEHISVGDILQETFAPGTFQDKIVIVAATATAVYDVRSTPVGPVFPGGEVHATVVDNILTQRFMTQPGWVRLFNLLGIVVLGGLIGVVMSRTRAFRGFLFATLLFVFHVFVVNGLFVYYGLWCNLVYPLLSLLTAYVVLSVYHYVTEERERRRVRHAFSHYLSPNVIEEMLSDFSNLSLGGKKREITAMFTDIEGFTSFSEALEPEELVHLLNEYFDQTCDIVLRYNGTIDKIVGDSLHVLFNAPVDQVSHASDAIKCALELDACCTALREEQSKRGAALGRTRIGINTGFSVVGNFGGAARFDYTAHGDAIDTAARLEGANKYVGTRLCVSASTMMQCKDVESRPIGWLLLKGKSNPIEVYEPLAPSAAPIAYNSAYLEAYEQMAQHKLEALERFEALARQYPEDDLISYHANRLRAGGTGAMVEMVDK